MKKKIILFILIVLSTVFSSLAQTLKGKVSSENEGAPLPGVSIAIKGTNVGTTTDANGNYSLATSGDNVLIVSFIGYKTQEIPLNKRSILNIILEEGASSLDEVVITALGISKAKKKIGFSVTEVEGKTLANTTELNPISALQGRVAGVQIDQSAGGLSAGTKILIRGNSTLGTNNQPIFVVDGVILDNDLSGGSGRDFGNNLKNLNMEDYESVSILKGSAAAALYGTRAINGVVLLTTKKGLKRKGIGVNVTQTLSMQDPYRGPDLQNDFGGGTVGAFFTDTRDPNYKANESWTTKVFPINSAGQPYIDQQIGRELENWGPRFADQPVINYDGKPTNYRAVKNNYLDGFQTGKGSLTNVSIDGGSDKSTFRLSYNNSRNTGINFKNKLDKNAFNLRVTQDLTKFLKADVTADYTATEVANPPNLSLNNYIWIFPRNYDTKYWLQRKNYIGYNGGLRNPNDPNEPNKVPGADHWFNIFENDYTQKEQMIRGRLALTATLTDWLKFQVEGNFNNIYSKQEIKENGKEVNFAGGRYGLGHEDKATSFLKWMAMFNKKISSDIDLIGYIGGEIQKTKVTYNYSETNGGLSYPSNYFLANSVLSPFSNGGTKLNREYKSLYASADLGWRDQIYLNATWRADWASALTYTNGSGNNNYNYPALSASWVFSNTLNSKLPEWITFGKLRMSYATLGGDLDPFQINQAFAFNGFTRAGGNGDQPTSTFKSATTLQPNIKPLRKIAKEIGLEMRGLNNRFGFDISLYRDNSKNQAIPISADIASGVSSILINAGNIQNQGIEITLDATPIKIGNFSWNMLLTYSRNRNKIIELFGDREYFPLENEGNGGNDLIPYAKVGGTYGVVRTRIAAKRYKNENANDPKNGMAILQWRGDARAAFPARSNEWKDVGDINAKFRSGFENTFTFKKVSLNILLDAKIGGDMIITSLRYGTHTGIFANSLKGRDAQNGGITWTSKYDGITYDDGILPDGVFEKGQKITQADGTSVDVGGLTFAEAYKKGFVEPTHLPQFGYRYGSFSTAVGDYWISENSWISLRQVALTYQLPASIYSKIGLNNLSVNLIGRDLLYLYNTLPLNFNPASNASNSTSVQKEVGFIPPMTRSFAITLRAGF